MLNVFNARTTPAIDGLVIITNHHKLIIAARQNPEPGVLNGVGVLKLIDQDILKPLLVVLENLRIFQPEFVGAKQNFTKVNHAPALAFGFICCVDLQHGLGVVIIKMFDISRTQAFVFLRVDIPLTLFCRPSVIVYLQ